MININYYFWRDHRFFDSTLLLSTQADIFILFRQLIFIAKKREIEQFCNKANKFKYPKYYSFVYSLDVIQLPHKTKTKTNEIHEVFEYK